MNSSTVPEGTAEKPQSSYVMASEWEREEFRLKGLEEHYDPGTIGVLTAFDLQPGSRCLEVGAGAGSIARWLSTAVGPTGRVIATDIDVRFLAGQEASGLRVLQHDITSDDLGEGEFDLIHARAVVEHLRDRQSVVDRLAALLAPGGRLLLEDLDNSPATVAAAVQHVSRADVAARMSGFADACVQLLSAAGADGCYGIKLPGALDVAGLTEVTAEVRFKTFTQYPESWLALSLERLKGPFLAMGILDEAEYDALLGDFSDPTLRLPGATLVAAHGRRSAG